MTISSTSQEKILVVGCGDIGQRLAHQIDGDRYRIIGMRRNPPADLPYLVYRRGNTVSPDEFGLILNDEQPDVIVISMTSAERTDAGYEQAYVQTCHNLVLNLRHYHQQPRLIIFVSSTAVYAQQDGSWIDETASTMPDSFSGTRLLEAEHLVQTSGFPHCIVRFSGIYGPGRYRLIEQVKQGRASSSPHYTNRIYADDCARALAHLIERQRTGTIESLYLASDSAPTPMVEVVSWIAGQLGIESFLAPDAVNERGNKRIGNQRLLDSGFRLRYPDFRSGYVELIEQYQRTNI